MPLHRATPDLMSGGRSVSPMTRMPSRRRSSVPSMGRAGNGPQSSSAWCSTRRSHSGSRGESAGISRTRSRTDCTVSWKVSSTSIKVFKGFFFRFHLITGLRRGPPRTRGESSPDLLMNILTLCQVTPEKSRWAGVEEGHMGAAIEVHSTGGRGVQGSLGGHSSVRMCRITRRCVEDARWRGSINS